VPGEGLVVQNKSHSARSHNVVWWREISYRRPQGPCQVMVWLCSLTHTSATQVPCQVMVWLCSLTHTSATQVPCQVMVWLCSLTHPLIHPLSPTHPPTLTMPPILENFSIGGGLSNRRERRERRRISTSRPSMTSPKCSHGSKALASVYLGRCACLATSRGSCSVPRTCRLVSSLLEGCYFESSCIGVHTPAPSGMSSYVSSEPAEGVRVEFTRRKVVRVYTYEKSDILS
jgi:hypothetical protein